MAQEEKYNEAMEVLSRKWCPKIIGTLLDVEEAQFNELKSHIDGVSNKALSDSLNYLKEKKIVEKKEREEREVYVLTGKGESMEEIMNSVRNWSRKFSESSTLSVLVVEDDSEQAELYARWLEPEYDVSTANQKSDFYSKIDSEKDIVLLDRDLKDSSAEDLFRESDSLEDLPVILITGKEPKKDIIDLDISGYMLKPVSKDELRKEVSEVLDNADRPDKLQKLASLIQKRKALDRKSSGKESEEYVQLLEKIQELSEDLEPEKIEQIRR